MAPFIEETEIRPRNYGSTSSADMVRLSLLIDTYPSLSIKMIVQLSGVKLTGELPSKVDIQQRIRGFHRSELLFGHARHRLKLEMAAPIDSFSTSWWDRAVREDWSEIGIMPYQQEIIDRLDPAPRRGVRADSIRADSITIDNIYVPEITRDRGRANPWREYIPARNDNPWRGHIQARNDDHVDARRFRLHEFDEADLGVHAGGREGMQAESDRIFRQLMEQHEVDAGRGLWAETLGTADPEFVQIQPRDGGIDPNLDPIAESLRIREAGGSPSFMMRPDGHASVVDSMEILRDNEPALETLDLRGNEPEPEPAQQTEGRLRQTEGRIRRLLNRFPNPANIFRIRDPTPGS